MQIFTDPAALQAQCQSWHRQGESIALVPTMGFYHAGHEKLMKHGRALADKLIISLFVNPAQFGPGEDLAAYPRDLERDRQIAESCGADILFVPEPSAMYANDHATWVEVPELAGNLCGKSRPTHFRGVCTVVLKLLMLVAPDWAIFGEKDWQQQAIIKRMVRDLNVPVNIIALPTAREADGLALSSRNVYLSIEERNQAPMLRKGLLLAREQVASGLRDGEILRKNVLDFWRLNFPLARVDYLALTDPDTLRPLATIQDKALLACAAYVGRARLIDNILLETITTENAIQEDL